MFHRSLPMPDHISNEAPRQGLSDLAPEAWFTKRDQSTFWLRIYTCLFIPHDTFVDQVRQLFSDSSRALSIRPGVPLLVACGTVKDIAIPAARFELTAAPSGQLIIRTNVDSRPLPDSPFVFLATPFTVDGAGGNESTARTFLDEAAALICLHTGQNFMRDILFDGEVDAVGNKISIPSSAIKMPQPSEGPFLNQLHGNNMVEISTALRSVVDIDRRNRLLLALRLMNSAMRE